ncbi:hypothetical protein B0T24DRAFT_269821 [Lasiosphaeria ovina]|uniref:Mmc1 C-terminal domain-containing protein n=1 Tax=Lasiosphaeria ovina TaxID=92902 RepID=A0AAE0KBE7_9PEZI|nr:hypothetical protein B0T24DRAFT_269821 [Lasiosphaeria ovina]
MPTALGLRRVLAQSRVLGRAASPSSSASVCLFCSFSRRPAPTAAWIPSRRKPLPTLGIQRRRQSATTTVSSTPAETAVLSDPRQELESALRDLQSHAPNYVNLARVQLALRNLAQQPGHESIRVAILALTNGSESGRIAKKLLSLVLADPLKPAADWEAQLEAHDVSQPLIIRVGAAGAGAGASRQDSSEILATAKGHAMPELSVSSPAMDKSNLEIVITRGDSLTTAAQPGGALALEDAVLVPTVDVPTPTSSHPTRIAAPVHMALLVGDGILGAASLLSLPLLEDRDIITCAVNFKQLSADDLSGCPVTGINVDAGNKGLQLLRASVGNAMEFQTLWSESNIGQIREWLTTNVLPSGEAATKAPVRHLISSLLQNAGAAIQAEEARDLSESTTGNITPQALARLNLALSEWAQASHEELEQQLEVAFADRAWEKLGWWKLFWRVDDVSMLSSEMLALRFLPGAERTIIYLAGRVREAGVTEGDLDHPVYPGPVLTLFTTGRGNHEPALAGSEAKWPQHIPFTRNYLQETTIPALQALAQKLVLQSLTTSTLATALAGLSYLSALGAYECGAIAALGIVWSLRRLQKKWDAARDFWEGEVREEGRKAVRASEASIAEVLDRATKSQGDGFELLGELRRAKDIIQRAEGALARLK